MSANDAELTRTIQSIVQAVKESAIHERQQLDAREQKRLAEHVQPIDVKTIAADLMELVVKNARKA